MKSLPAIPCLQIVKQYAQANGLGFWTLKEMMTAWNSYNEIAKLKN